MERFYDVSSGTILLDGVSVKSISRSELREQIGYVDAVYQINEVEEISSFIANPGEAYLLDVREIHNVEPIGETTIRKALALRTKKYVYDEVLAMLKQTGYV
jgi:hypothetical protein